jgi:hypothetical protein
VCVTAGDYHRRTADTTKATNVVAAQVARDAAVLFKLLVGAAVVAIVISEVSMQPSARAMASIGM